MSADQKLSYGARVRHLKSGTFYRVVGEAEIQAEKPIVEGDRITIYRADRDGALWARSSYEFKDGRFEHLALVAPEPNAGNVDALGAEITHFGQKCDEKIGELRADRDRLAAELDAVKAENNTLRGLLAKGDKDCLYCGLPAAEIAKCASGFPGCARMDDIVCAQETKAEAERDWLAEELDAAKAMLAKAREALIKIKNDGSHTRDQWCQDHWEQFVEFDHPSAEIAAAVLASLEKTE